MLRSMDFIKEVRARITVRLDSSLIDMPYFVYQPYNYLIKNTQHMAYPPKQIHKEYLKYLNKMLYKC